MPLPPFGERTREAVAGLQETDRTRLAGLGLLTGLEYDDGEGPKIDYVPVWTLRSAYGWEAVVPAGEEVEVVHRYRPSVGGTVAATFLPTEGDASSEQRYAEYKAKYCVDDHLVAALRKSAIKTEGYENIPFTKSWNS